MGPTQPLGPTQVLGSTKPLGPNQPPIQWESRFFAWVKRPGRDVEHSPPFRSEVKNKWIYTSLPHMPSWNVQEQLYLFTVNYCIGETLETFVTALINWIPVTFPKSVMFRSLKTATLVCLFVLKALLVSFSRVLSYPHLQIILLPIILFLLYFLFN